MWYVRVLEYSLLTSYSVTIIARAIRGMCMYGIFNWALFLRQNGHGFSRLSRGTDDRPLCQRRNILSLTISAHSPGFHSATTLGVSGAARWAPKEEVNEKGGKEGIARRNVSAVRSSPFPLSSLKKIFFFCVSRPRRFSADFPRMRRSNTIIASCAKLF